MFRALLLQQWFNLSDRDLSEAIADRLSFKSFLGLSLSDPVPDDTTFCRFRQKLQEESLLEKLFLLLDGQDDDYIGITRNGKIYYKSDPDARWTVKRGKLPCGYKVHVNADESGIARRLEMTPANVHDSSKQ